MIAFAICINFVGGQIALLLKLPIYLDSIGTVFVASILVPVLWNASKLTQWSVNGNDCGCLFPVLCTCWNCTWFCDWSCIQKMAAEKMVDPSCCCCDHTSIYTDQFLYYCVFVWWNYILRIFYFSSDSFQNTAWNGRKLLYCPVYYRLCGQSLVSGSICSSYYSIE